MKISHILCILAIVILTGVGIFMSRIVPGIEGSSRSFSVKDLPSIALEECVNVRKLIARNPFSPMPNEYLLVTKYEEKPEEPGAIKQGLMFGKALNIYLIHDLLLLKDLETGIVHDTVLIVNVITTDSKSSRETVREWVLIDEDGDRSVDRGVFHEILRERGKDPTGSKEIEFPRERLKDLQKYYERTTKTLNSKAESGATERCVVT